MVGLEGLNTHPSVHADSVLHKLAKRTGTQKNLEEVRRRRSTVVSYLLRVLKVSLLRCPYTFIRDTPPISV